MFTLQSYGQERSKGLKPIAALLIFLLLIIVAISGCANKQGSKSSSIKQVNAKVDRLIRQLGKWDGTPDKIPEAANKLVKIGEPAIVPLINKLASKDINAELWSEEVLKIIGPSAVPHLIAALNDKDVTIRGGAATVLGGIGDKRAVKPLIALLSDQDNTKVGGVTVREIAEYSLGQIGDRRAVDPLISLLKDTKEGVRYRAAIALEEIGDERALDPLIAALELEKDALAKEQMAASIQTLKGEVSAPDDTQPDGASSAGDLPSDFPSYTQEVAGANAFSTSNGVAQVASFYQNELIARGWEIQPGANMFIEGPNGYASATVVAGRNAESVVVTATKDAGDQETEIVILYTNMK